MNRYTLFKFLACLGMILLLSQSVQPAAAQDEADLYLSVTADRTKVKVGEEVTYTLTLTNLGQAPATNIVSWVSLPDLLNWVSFSYNAGSANSAFWRLDSLASGATATATLVATPISNYGRQERSMTTFFSAQADTPDSNSANNSLYVEVRIIGKLPPSIH